MSAGPGKITCAHQARLVMGKLRVFCIPNEDVEILIEELAAAALEIIMLLDEKVGTMESEYLIPSQARSLMNRLTR
jgi:hypothetical protein